MAFNSGIIRASISVSSRRLQPISSLLLVLAVILSAESVLSFATTNSYTQTSFNYCASSSAWNSRSIQQPFTTSHIPTASRITTNRQSRMSTTSLNSQSLPSETLSSLQQIAIKASKLCRRDNIRECRRCRCIENKR